jgi:hypothetical protein
VRRGVGRHARSPLLRWRAGPVAGAPRRIRRSLRHRMYSRLPPGKPSRHSSMPRVDGCRSGYPDGHVLGDHLTYRRPLRHLEPARQGRPQMHPQGPARASETESPWGVRVPPATKHEATASSEEPAGAADHRTAEAEGLASERASAETSRIAPPGATADAPPGPGSRQRDGKPLGGESPPATKYEAPASSEEPTGAADHRTAEAEGLEPPRACARRISSAVPYQLDYASGNFGSLVSVLTLYFHRGARIRTGDLCDPNAALYRTEPRPVTLSRLRCRVGRSHCSADGVG